MLPANQPLLVIDAATPRLQVGVWQDGAWLGFSESRDQALQGIFTAVRKVLGTAELGLAEVAGFVFCEGPGSVLRLRLAAIAIEGWRRFPPVATHPSPAARPESAAPVPALPARPLWAYRSLDFAAAALMATGEQPPFSIISDFRQKQWNRLLVNADGETEFGQVDFAWIASRHEAVHHIRQRKLWEEPPPNCAAYPYCLADFAKVLAKPGLVYPVERPEAFVPQGQSFVRWKPDRHRRK